MTDETSQPAGGDATTENIEDRLASFDFDPRPAAPQRAETQEAGDEPELTEAAAAEDVAPEQPDEDDPEINLRDNSKVRLSELKKAWNPDYKRHQEELAQQRREIEQRQAQFQNQVGALSQQEQRLAKSLDDAILILQNRLPKPPDRTLLETDPFAFQQQQVAYADAVTELNGLAQKKQSMMYEAHQRFEHQKQAYVQKQKEELTSRMPDLKDPVKMTKFWERVKSYGVSKGLTQQSMLGIVDAVHWDILNDAASWREHVQRQAKIKEKAKEAAPMPPPTTAPARRQSSAERERAGMRDQLTRLRRTGSAKDGEAFLSQFD